MRAGLSGSRAGAFIDRCRRSSIAPAWHTALLTSVLVASGLAPMGHAPATPIAAALTLAVIEILLALYVAAGLRNGPRAISALIGRPRLVSLELVVGAICGAALLGSSLLAQRWSPDQSAAAVSALMPSTLRERALWIAVAAIVAVSEELVFRGYLQKQFEAIGGFILAAFLQSALFALAHANQGWSAALRVGLCGLLLTLLVRQRRGLIAAIAAHFALDAYLSFAA